MFENPMRGRQARNFTATNVPKILNLKSSSEQIFPKIDVGCPCLNAIADLISSIVRLLNETSSVVSSREILKCGYIKENDEKYPPPDSS